MNAELRNPPRTPNGLRKDLIIMRAKYGAKSPIGHRCSNIIQLCRSGASVQAINRQVLDLAKLMAAR